MKSNKKIGAALAVIPLIAAAGTWAYIIAAETYKFAASTHANLVLWNMMKSEDCTARDIARSPYLDRLSSEDLWELIDESIIDGKPEITAVLMEKAHERKGNAAKN